MTENVYAPRIIVDESVHRRSIPVPRVVESLVPLMYKFVTEDVPIEFVEYVTVILFQYVAVSILLANVSKCAVAMLPPIHSRLSELIMVWKTCKHSARNKM